jgi:kojibiose phosphorylase
MADLARSETRKRRGGTRTVHPPASPTSDREWIVVEDGFTLTREHEVESLLAIGNGYVGSRASLAEGCALSAPATFVAGVFSGEPGSVPALAPSADWSRLSITVEGHPLRLDRGQRLDHRRILDLRQGMLWREWRHQDADGRITRLRELRFASLADRHLLVQSVTLTAENYSGRVTVDASTRGALTQVTDSGIDIAMALSMRLIEPRNDGIGTIEVPHGELSFPVRRGRTCRIDRVAAVHTSRDTDEPAAAARLRAMRAVGDLAGIIAQHRDAWIARWSASDLRVEGDRDAQRALRFAVYHLVSAANPDDERVSIGARGLAGTAYKGHVFWDTDIFMLPFFLLTYPEAARALVMYRYHTLAGARAKAARLGYRGAFYAWESTDSGDETTPSLVLRPDGEAIRIPTGEQELHISADVAFAAWSYSKATGDERFLTEAGAEILIETARFWASRVVREDDARYHIRGVIGPDEYHETIDDNAYTNIMAQWNLETAEEVTRLLAGRWPAQWQALSCRLGLEDGEPARWREIARNLYTGFDERTGLFEQFQGYFGLEEIDPAAFQPRSAPMDVLLGRERTQQSQVIKQADVVMLIYLLWERFPPPVRRVNFEYYEPRCGHGSSLSPAIHALVAARLGKTALAERYFRQAAEIDLADNMGNASGGIHAATMGGLWQAAAFGFAGLRLNEDGPELHPSLPPAWRSLSMRIQWRGRRHELTTSGQSARGRKGGDQ